MIKKNKQQQLSFRKLYPSTKIELCFKNTLQQSYINPPNQKNQETPCDRKQILKSKADSDVDMKQDLFEFDFELRLSDGLEE